MYFYMKIQFFIVLSKAGMGQKAILKTKLFKSENIVFSIIKNVC